MKNIFKKILDSFKEDLPEPPESKEDRNRDTIDIYNQLKRDKIIPEDEPNYTLAEDVFREFNSFNLKNIKEINHMYLRYIPKSLLPYPKNYIKCAYYLFLEYAKKNNSLELLKLIQGVGVELFINYPDYKKYKEDLTGKNTNGNGKKWIDNALKDISPNPRESFKKLYGVYEISEEDYNSSPSSIDSTNEKLIHDFGILPEIEEDIDEEKIQKEIDDKKKQKI